MKFVLIALVAANLALLAWFQGWMAPYGGDGREPQRSERQIGADRIRVMPVDEAPKAQSNEAPAAAPAAGPAESATEPAASPEPAARAPEPARRPR